MSEPGSRDARILAARGLRKVRAPLNKPVSDPQQRMAESRTSREQRHIDPKEDRL